MASSSHSSSYARGARIEQSPESYESLRMRNAAAEILQSYEKLSWHSYARRETLQQTRLHFQNIVAGFTSEDEAALVDWPTDNSPLPNRDGDVDRGSRRTSNSTDKGKGRGGGAAQNGSMTNSGGKGMDKSIDSISRSDASKKKRKG